MKNLLANWYSEQAPSHALQSAWMRLSHTDVTIVADNVAPLAVPVTSSYELWQIAGNLEHRVPWKVTYDAPFALHYQCHSADGEKLLVQGSMEVSVDRQVTTNGLPIHTPTATGALLLHRVGKDTSIMLGAAIVGNNSGCQFALRNALIWTTAPSSVIVSGFLVDENHLDAGSARFTFGVRQWTSTLPDPYVSSASVGRYRGDRGDGVGILVGDVSWSSPTEVAVRFDGDVGVQIAIRPRDPSAGDPRPAPRTDGGPQIGPTQVDQDRLTFDKKGLAVWRDAQLAEEEGRAQRNEAARQQDELSGALVDRVLNEIGGKAPNVLLLDVSTNRDLLGVAIAAGRVGSGFPVSDLAVQSEVGNAWS